MAPRVAVLQFPGSNADWDALHAARDVAGMEAYYVFHKATSLDEPKTQKRPDAVILPGGFSYGDYLRAGAIARFSPVIPALLAFAKAGGPVLGICNGFQILTELGILPGSLTRNHHLHFECRDVFVRVEATGPFTEGVPHGTLWRLPVSHAEGRYQCDDATLQRLEAEGRIAFRYCSADGTPQTRPSLGPNIVPAALPFNPNGSRANIAGLYNDTGNVLGLMPHPERAAEALLGNTDGLQLFQALGRHLAGRP